MRFFVRILGARTPPPKMDEPVMKMPLQAPPPPNRIRILLSATFQTKKEKSGKGVPSCSEDGEADAQADTHQRPEVGRRLLEEPTGVER